MSHQQQQVVASGNMRSSHMLDLANLHQQNGLFDSAYDDASQINNNSDQISHTVANNKHHNDIQQRVRSVANEYGTILKCSLLLILLAVCSISTIESASFDQVDTSYASNQNFLNHQVPSIHSSSFSSNTAQSNMNPLIYPPTKRDQTRGLAAEDDRARVLVGSDNGASSLDVEKFKSHSLEATVARTTTLEQERSSNPIRRILNKRSTPWATIETHNQQQKQQQASGATGYASHLPLVSSSAGLTVSADQHQQQQQQRARSLLMPINELRVSGSKLEPPSRPSVDWSKQRPYFGPNIERSVSVELGKTAHLACKVFELGDKTVSWLRPRENEILTAGKYTYIGDSRISSMNENGSNDWILEIKDVGLNDSTSYECQVSTDPKMSLIINLHVQAARARIKQGENNYYPSGANIEFACDILPPLGGAHQHRQQHLPSFTTAAAGSSSTGGLHSSASSSSGQTHQIYWYHDGNLINYARSGAETTRTNTNFTIDWDPVNQMSRLKLYNIRPSDSGNYTCKPTSAEPATVKLFVKKQRNSSNANRVTYSGDAYYVPNGKAAQRNRQQQQLYGLEASSSVFDNASSSASSLTTSIVCHLLQLASLCWSLLHIACSTRM